MKTLPPLLLMFASMLGFAAPGQRPPARWRLFESKTQHFTLRYPPSWNRLVDWNGVPDPDMLDIINFPNSERAKGVVIKRGGAEIHVGGAPEFIDSVDKWIHRFLFEDQVIDQGEIPVSVGSPNGCTKLERVITRSEVSPGAYQIVTAYYCTVAGGRFYGIFLTNWEGDPHQRNLQDTALKIALSLRSR